MKGTKRSIRITAMVLALIMAVGMAGCAGAGAATDVSTHDAKSAAISKAAAEPASADDTVYVISDAEGNITKLVGCGENDLPVSVKISYTLDGKPVTPEELAGKSGKVTIRFDYDNHLKTDITIDDKTEQVNIPVAMLSGLILDKEKFSDVSVNSGRVTDDGTRFIIAGLAIPGLKDAIDPGHDNEDLKDLEEDLADYVEVTANANDFALDMTMTLAMPDLLDQLDLSKATDIDTDELSESADKLTDGMKKLVDGSGDLADGIDKLYDGSKDLSDGADKLVAGADQLKDGCKSLDKGADQICTGTSQLSSGLDKLSKNSDKLNDGAKKVFETLLGTATRQIKASGIDCPELTIKNYQKVLNKLINSLDKKAVYKKVLAEVTKAVEAKRGDIKAAVTQAVRKEVTAQVTEAVKEQVLSQVLAAKGLDMDTYKALDDATRGAIDAAVEAQMKTDGVKAKITAATDGQMSSEKIQGLIDKNTDDQVDKAISETMASDAIQAKLKEASEGAKSLISLKASLDDYNSFYIGLKTYTDGVDKAAAGADKLKTGAKQLSDGTGKVAKGSSDLYDGLVKLQDNLPALKKGIKKLLDGSRDLESGLKKFDDEGISKITDLINGDMMDALKRSKAVFDASKDYAATHPVTKYVYKSGSVGEV